MFQTQLLLWGFVAVVAFLATGLRMRLDHKERRDQPRPPPDAPATTFVRFHAARLRLFRQGGGIVGFIAGYLIGLLRHRVDGGPILIAMLAGSLIGSLLAEREAWFPKRTASGRASLEPRERAGFLSKGSRTVEVVVGFLLVGSGALAATYKHGTRLILVLSVITAAVVVLVASRIGQRRIAERPFDINDAGIAGVDRKVRSASMESLAATSAGLVLCCTAWLFAVAQQPQGAVVTVDGIEIFRERPASSIYASVGPVGDQREATIQWTGAGGVRLSRSIDLGLGPTDPGQAAKITTQFDDGLSDRPWALASVLSGLWAFRKWRRAGRIPKEMLGPLLVSA